MTKRPQVLHYVGYLRDSGGILSVVRGLSEAGVFECILGVSPGFVQSRSPALPLLELPAMKGEKIDLVAIWRARRVAAVVQKWLRADENRIFHGHSRAGLLVTLWLARWNEPRVVASVHCYGRQRWFYRLAAARLLGRVYWLTPQMKAYYGFNDHTWINCMPGGIDPEKWKRNGPQNEQTVVIAGIGAIVDWKGWDLILKAIAQLPESIRARVIFRHIGSHDGSPASIALAAKLRSESQMLPLRDCVQWLGEQSSAYSLLAEARLLVIPSRSEPLSMAMLESLAMGVPVLAADSGGPRDVIVPDSTGWFFRTGDAGDLCQTLTRIISTSALASLAPPPSLPSRFSVVNVAGEWLSIYRDLT